MDEIAILNFSDPLVLIVLGGTGFLFLLLLMVVRASMRTAKLAEPLAHQMGALGQRVQALGEGQERLAGGLHHVSEAQAQAICMQTQDFHRAYNAFVAKQSPVFEGN